MVRDELVTDNATLRPPWLNVIEEFERLGLAEIGNRRDELAVLLEQDGVTYNVTSDTERPYRPWKLDALPLVVPAEDWAAVERGVAQRAELANLVLTDLLGERRLLRQGLIPPALVFADPQFNRAADGIRLPGDHQLVTMGADLTRSLDGGWSVLGQRAEAPSGAWYALENRRVLSRVFPSLFRRTEVLRLVPFVRAIRAALRRVAPSGIENPSIVVLSPGPRSETAFEHASIAADLGFPLVEGADLTVRQGRVWLRTIGDRTEPVDVILRRLDTSFCDPLELRANSTLGVPGLVDAARAGAVSIVNPLGSGLVESAGLAPRWAELCRQLLGADLELPSVPAWWCGDAAGLSHVLANLGEVVVRPLSRETLEHSLDTAMASTGQLDDLRRRIEAAPHQWVGQERVHPPTTPVFSDSGLVPRPTVVRAYAVAQTDDYLVMDGGLARAAAADDAAGALADGSVDQRHRTQAAITTRTGAIAKDIWVISDEPEPETHFWIDGAGLPARVNPMLPARAAENLYWLGRFAERAEAAIRLHRTINGRRNEFDAAAAGPGPAALAVLLGALSLVTETAPGFIGDDAETEARIADPFEELRSLVVDADRPGTIAHAVDQMFRSIDVLRDKMSVDTWLVVGALETRIAELGEDTEEETIVRVLDDLLEGLLALAGLTHESMVRDDGWYFTEVGRRIERSLKLLALVRATLGTERGVAAESVILESVLMASESIITYRRRYRSRARVSTGLDLMLLDAANPRSLAFQVERLVEAATVIESGHEPREGIVEDSSQKLSALLAEISGVIEGLSTVTLAAPDSTGTRVGLDQSLDRLADLLNRAAEELAATYFTRQLPQQQHAPVGFGNESLVRDLDSEEVGPV